MYLLVDTGYLGKTMLSFTMGRGRHRLPRKDHALVYKREVTIVVDFLIFCPMFAFFGTILWFHTANTSYAAFSSF